MQVVHERIGHDISFPAGGQVVRGSSIVQVQWIGILLTDGLELASLHYELRLLQQIPCKASPGKAP